MNCYLYAISGLGLLGGSLATLTVSKEQHNILRNVFSDELDEKYNNIVIERRNHYLIGLLSGIVISTLIIKQLEIFNHFMKIMMFLTITLGVAVLCYMLLPKSDYMLNYLQTPFLSA